jgi:serine phosphatase RsbU (regulator of sigma subunit)
MAMGGAVLLLVLALFIFNRYKIKQKANTLLEKQKTEINNQKIIIEVKQKEIIDSINYAKRIQYTLLANADFLNEHLPEHFVFFQPKDIVSGDFYWATTINNKFVLVTADCTGHGVPGAFMSLLNMSFLNEAIIEKKIDSPDKILDYVRERIIHSLNPEGAETESKDGMDATVCIYDFKGGWLRFASANNPLWVIRKNELIEFKADKMPVGNYYGDLHPFTLNTLGLRKGDIVYSFTDGFSDQFGGESGKKFKYKPLQQLLLANCDKPMQEQKNILEKTINDWKGNLEQVDDILVIGIRI